MAALKYSRQREAIKNYLQGREDHPSADMVYDGIRGEFPNISLGTVYRNLSLLTELERSSRSRQKVRIVLMREWRRIIISYVRAADGSWTL